MALIVAILSGVAGNKFRLTRRGTVAGRCGGAGPWRAARVSMGDRYGNGTSPEMYAKFSSYVVIVQFRRGEVNRRNQSKATALSARGQCQLGVYSTPMKNKKLSGAAWRLILTGNIGIGE